MDYEKKIEAYRNAIESVLIDEDYSLDQKFDTLNILFDELHGCETLLEFERSQAGKTEGAQ